MTFDPNLSGDARQYAERELPIGWEAGMRVRLLADDEEGTPEEFGELQSSCVLNGTVIVVVDEGYRDLGDDGMREVMLEIVVPEEGGGDDPKLPRDAWDGGFAENH